MKIVDILWSQTHKHKYSPLYLYVLTIEEPRCVKMYCLENQSVNLVSVD